MPKADTIRRVLDQLPDADDIRPGQVYIVRDHVIEFPATPSADRWLHSDRWVIVVQDAALCGSSLIPTVQVVPCTTTLSSAPPFEFELSAGGPFLRDTVALVSITQPILKRHLGQLQGELTVDQLTTLLRKLSHLRGTRLAPSPRATRMAPSTPATSRDEGD